MERAQWFNFGFRYRQRPNVNIFITLLNCKKISAEVFSTLWPSRLHSQLESTPSPCGFPSIFGTWFWPVLGKVLSVCHVEKWFCFSVIALDILTHICSSHGKWHDSDSSQKLLKDVFGSENNYQEITGENKLKFQNTLVLICLEKQHYIFHFLGLLSFPFTNSNNLHVLEQENAWNTDFKTCCSECCPPNTHLYLLSARSLDSTSTVFNNKSPKCRVMDW